MTIEHAECLTNWFQYLTTLCKSSCCFFRFLKTLYFLFLAPKLPSLTSSSHTLTNRILLLDIIQNFTQRLNESKPNPYKHESLHGTIYRCNPERTLYLPVPSLDQLVNSFRLSIFRSTVFAFRLA